MSTATGDNQADGCWQICLFICCCLWSAWSLMQTVPATNTSEEHLMSPGADYTHTPPAATTPAELIFTIILSNNMHRMVRLTVDERRGLPSHDLLQKTADTLYFGNDHDCLYVINILKYTILEFISFCVISLNVLCIIMVFFCFSE